MQVYTCPPEQQDMFAARARREAFGSAGLPVGVQVAALPFHDETVLRVMGMLEGALGDRVPVLPGLRNFPR
jgi:Asp-tRNA(Asn)/Glu-tRNA(Gln) amidotransferase A subunit family amidase